MNQDWIGGAVQLHSALTTSIKATLTSLLTNADIDFLSVDGRTKTADGVSEKVRRKGYSDPPSQMTDISGLRVIVYFEDDVRRVAELVETAFAVDRPNSLDQSQLLASNQNGYRSVHYVCDLGPARAALPEFAKFNGLKFEIQIRTVLQHAWAEIAHDRNYKFTGSLPSDIERELFLYAGMLEIADRGFNSVAKKIDDYVASTKRKTRAGNLDIHIDSITLPSFVKEWAELNDYSIRSSSNTTYIDIIDELRSIGVLTLKQLANIIPADYTKLAEGVPPTNIFGLTRDWMIISQHEKLLAAGVAKWGVSDDDIAFYKKFLDAAAIRRIRRGLPPSS